MRMKNRPVIRSLNESTSSMKAPRSNNRLVVRASTPATSGQLQVNIH